MNMFSYCGNDPINNIDPSGHGPLDTIKNALNKAKYKINKAKYKINETVVDVTRDIIDDSLNDEKMSSKIKLIEEFGGYWYEKANNYTKERYGDKWNEDNTEANAFKHAMWNAIMTLKMGAEKAKEYADAHEAPNINDYPEQCEMDFHNNQLGRDIAELYPDKSLDFIADKIQKQ
jgi:hypothetical protein